MDLILLLFIGGTCAYVGAKILSSDERNKVFTLPCYHMFSARMWFSKLVTSFHVHTK